MHSTSLLSRSSHKRFFIIAPKKNRIYNKKQAIIHKFTAPLIYLVTNSMKPLQVLISNCLFSAVKKIRLFLLGFLLISGNQISAATPGLSDTLAPPVFSQQSGFFTQDFTLIISSPQEGVSILYTLDGSVPEVGALGGRTYQYKNFYPYEVGQSPGPFLTGSCDTYFYSGGILITDRSTTADSMTHHASTYHNTHYYFPETPVFKGTVVRARCVKEGWESSPVVTHVYFVTPHGRARYSLSVLNISINEDLMYEYHNGIYTAGVDFDNWRLASPQSITHAGRPANYWRRGAEWEYPAHLSFFEPLADTVCLSMDMGVRVHGAWSSAFPMKSFRLYARSDYGTSKFNHNIFPNLNYDSYKRLILRNSGNDWQYTNFKDGFIQAVVSHMRFDTQAYRPAITFINGEYWGIHNLRERYDKHYFERVYGIKENDLDYLEMNALPIEGDNLHYQETIQYINDNDLAQEDHYQHIKTRIDTDNYIDYQIAQIFVGNIDWPGNNVDFFRKRTTQYEPNAAYGHDGRWRWMVFDLDYGFGQYQAPADYNMLEHATAIGSTSWQNPDWGTFLFRNMLKNEEFRTQFIIRFSDMLNTTFLSSRIIEVMEEFRILLEPEIREHLKRWKRPENITEWRYHINYIKNYVNQRPNYQRIHLKEFFLLEDSLMVSLTVSHPAHGFIRVNTINVNPTTPGVSQTPYPWKGWYFKNIPLEFEAIPYKGYEFSHWEGASVSTEPVVQFLTNENVALKAHFKKTESRELISFWHFDTSIPNDTPLDTLRPGFSLIEGVEIEFHSALQGYPFQQGHPLWRKASMERRNMPTSVNYQPEGNSNQEYNAAAMRGIQIKQPFAGDAGENTLFIHAPTTGFENVQLGFAAIDEEAVSHIIAEYSTSSGNPQWTSEMIENPIQETTAVYKQFKFDFSQIAKANDNPDFKIRLRFQCPNPLADNGKRITFNNISFEGNKKDSVSEPPLPTDSLFKVFPNPVTQHILHISPASDVKLFNLSGKLLLEAQNAESLNLKGISSGIYFLKNQNGECLKIMVLNP